MGLTTALLAMSFGVGLIVGLFVLVAGCVADERHDRRMAERRRLERQRNGLGR